MNKILYITVFVFSLFLLSCYDDEGNYDYREINEITVEGIESLYKVDVDDRLQITPVIKGTMYSDTSRFTYEWEVSDNIISDSCALDWVVNQIPGTKICRYIVKDKETGVKKYHQFSMNISSSTAGDLIVMLSKYQGTAELSYLRLDKPSNWAVNYVKDRFEKPIGSNPKQLSILYVESARTFPFTTRYGRVVVMSDDKAYLVNKETMLLDTITSTLEAEAFTGNASYPKPDTEGYLPEFMIEAPSIWRKSAYGNSYQQMTYSAMISGGSLYTAVMAPSVWTPSYSYKNESPYKEGYFTDFTFFDEMAPTPNNNLIQLGYDTGDLILFDKNNGRFASGSAYGGVSSIDVKYVKAFEGYDMIWGSATTISNSACVAVLNNGSTSKIVILSSGTTENERPTKKLTAEVNCNAVINASTKFYMMKYNTYLFFVTGNKLYRYNIMDAISGIAPTEANLIASLTDYGYDASAEIKDICVSRSEKTMLLAVSRYGSDDEGSGEEAKGDILGFDLNASTLEIKHNAERTFKGISGLPVDLEIKYQTHWRDGYYIDGTMKDNI